MAKYRPTATEVDAIQFTGNNWATMKAIAGEHNLDAAGNYVAPNFDLADNWWPDRPDKNMTAVVYVNGQWLGVHPNDWLVRDENGNVKVMSDGDFQVQFEAAT